LLLWRPRRYQVIHLFEVFRPKRSWRNEGITDELVSVLKPVQGLTEVDDSRDWILKKIRIPRIPVPGDEKDPLYRRGGEDLPEKRREELPRKLFLAWEHILVSLRGGMGWKQITAEDDNFRRSDQGHIQELLIEMFFPVEV